MFISLNVCIRINVVSETPDDLASNALTLFEVLLYVDQAKIEKVCLTFRLDSQGIDMSGKTLGQHALPFFRKCNFQIT